MNNINKKLVHINHKSVKHMTQSEFGAYLAGLWEADGHFSKQQQVVFAFHKFDLELANRLCAIFGHGHVSKIPEKEAYKWVISNRDGTIHFLKLVDGHLRLPGKLLQIKTNICCAKTSYFSVSKFSQKTIDRSSLTSSYWLAGFTDGNGCAESCTAGCAVRNFYIQMINRKKEDKAGRIEVRIQFKVAMKYPNILIELSKTFGSSVQKRTHSNGVITYYWSSTSLKNAYEVHKYFHRYHLQSSKYLNFYKWRKALRLVYEGKHTTPVGLAKIERLKNTMNKKLDKEEISNYFTE